MVGCDNEERIFKPGLPARFPEKFSQSMIRVSDALHQRFAFVGKKTFAMAWNMERLMAGKREQRTYERLFHTAEFVHGM